jgi:hypothetical protein
MLDSWSDDQIGPTLQAILLTAAHEPKTREKLRTIVEGELIGASTLATEEGERLRRSSLIASQLLGLALLRYVWKIEPVASMTVDELLAAIAPSLQHFVDGDIATLSRLTPPSTPATVGRPTRPSARKQSRRA